MSPGIAKSLAEALSVPLELVAFPGPGDDGDNDDVDDDDDDDDDDDANEEHDYDGDDKDREGGTCLLQDDDNVDAKGKLKQKMFNIDFAFR